MSEFEDALAGAIAERTGQDRKRDLAPRVLAAAVAGATRVAMAEWLRPDTTRPFIDILREAMACVGPAAAACERLGVVEFHPAEPHPIAVYHSLTPSTAH
jgi:hypothetical protein